MRLIYLINFTMNYNALTYDSVFRAISTIKYDVNIEIEFKILIRNYDELTARLNNILGNCAEEKTINCITDDNIVKQVLYAADNVKKVKYYKKGRLLTKVYLSNGIISKLAVSSEDTVAEHNIGRSKKYKLARYKNRRSCTDIAHPTRGHKINNWRIDITKVQTLRDIAGKIDITKFNAAPAAGTELEIEYIGKVQPGRKDIRNVISLIEYITSPNNAYRNALIRLADWIKPGAIPNIQRYSLKKLLPQVTSLNIKNYNDVLLPYFTKFFIAPKLDGVRSILLFDNEYKTYKLLNKTIKDLELLDFGCDIIGGNDRGRDETILDIELYGDVYYIIDIIAYRGKKVFNIDYNERLSYIQKITEEFAGCDKLIPKIIYPATKNKKKLKKILYEEYKYNTDGLIFTLGETIAAESNMCAKYIGGLVYKWKPLKDLTIDFITYSGRCELYCGITVWAAKKIMPRTAYGYVNKNEKYIPVKFTPTYVPRTKHSISELKMDSCQHNIVEVAWQNNGWVLRKIREDRAADVENGNYFGNDHRVADLIWHSIAWNIDLADILGGKPLTTKTPLAADVTAKLYQLYIENISERDSFVDIGTYFPSLIDMIAVGPTKIDFVLSDGFNCLDIINEKYSEKFIRAATKYISIHTYKPADYNVMDANIFYVGILPNDEQIEFILQNGLTNYKIILPAAQKNKLKGDISKISANYILVCAHQTTDAMK